MMPQMIGIFISAQHKQNTMGCIDFPQRIDAQAQCSLKKTHYAASFHAAKNYFFTCKTGYS